MKKTIVILLVLCLCVSLCACTKKPNPTKTTQEQTNEVTIEQVEETIEPTNEVILEQLEETTEPPVPEPEIWSVAKTVDEFGDITEDSEAVMQASFNGTFSNSATTDGELNGMVYILYNDENDRSYVGFKLFEYGNNPVTFSSYDEISFKTKVGDTIKEYDVSPNFMENGTLFIGVSMDWMNYDGNQLIDTLCNGKDIRCICYVNNSEYKFTIESGNFRTVYNQPGVGKVQIPGAFLGKWEYSSGDATVFSRIVSNGANIVETSNITIELQEETTAYGNHIPITVTGDDGSTDAWTVTFTLDEIIKNIGINLDTGYAQERMIELTEDKTLVLTVKYYQGEVGMGIDELKSKLKDESAVTIAVCEFKRVTP